jgi:DNA-binding XRE family transcriptional regulator
MVMSGSMSKKVPFRKSSDAIEFICGLCIARGRLRPRVRKPDQADFDLREWRKARKLTQLKLAEALGVDRSMVAKVEIGEKVLPGRWQSIISKM